MPNDKLCAKRPNFPCVYFLIFLTSTSGCCSSAFTWFIWWFVISVWVEVPKAPELGVQLDKWSRDTETPLVFKLYMLGLNMYLVDAKCPNSQIRTLWSFRFNSILVSKCAGHTAGQILFRFFSEMGKPRNFGYLVWNENQILWFTLVKFGVVWRTPNRPWLTVTRTEADSTDSRVPALMLCFQNCQATGLAISLAFFPAAGIKGHGLKSEGI